MDSQDIFIKPQEQNQDQIQEKAKRKQRKPMTPERKEVLLENLRKGRAKYKEQALARKAKVNETNDNTNITTDTNKEMPIKYNPKADIDELKETLRELKEMINKTKREENIQSKIENKIETIVNKTEPIPLPKPQPIPLPKPQPITLPKPQPITLPKPPEPRKKIVYSLFKSANW